MDYMSKENESKGLDSLNLEDNFKDAWDISEEDDFVDIDLDLGRQSDNPAPEEIFERPVRKLNRMANDPFAENEGTEDEASGRYQRKPENNERGSYSGGGKSGGYFSKNKNYIILILVCLAVIAAIMVILKLASKDNTETTAADTTVEASAETPAETVAWEEDTNAQVLDLVTRYYTAMKAVDMTSLQNIVDSSVTLDEAKIQAESQMIEGYQNVSCYTAPGIKEGEYAVYIEYSMKFEGIETAAPGLVPAYVMTDEEGALRLMTWEVVKENTELNNYMTSVANCDAIKQLAQSVQEAFDQALSNDEALRTLIEGIRGDAAETTAAGETTAAETTAAETTAAETTAAETTAAAATTAAATGEVTFEAIDTIRYTTTQVKCRTAPNTDDGTDFRITEAGTKVHVIGKGSEWCKLYLPDGTLGYIKSEFLTDQAPASAQ